MSELRLAAGRGPAIDPEFLAVAERRDQLRQDVIVGMARGLSLREIADELGVTYTAAYAAWLLVRTPTSPHIIRRVT